MRRSCVLLFVVAVLPLAGCTRYVMQPRSLNPTIVTAVEDGEVREFAAVGIARGSLLLEAGEGYLVRVCDGSHDHAASPPRSEAPCWPGTEEADESLLRSIVRYSPPHRKTRNVITAAEAYNLELADGPRIVVGLRPLAIAVAHDDWSGVGVRPTATMPTWATLLTDRSEEAYPGPWTLPPVNRVLVFPKKVVRSTVSSYRSAPSAPAGRGRLFILDGEHSPREVAARLAEGEAALAEISREVSDFQVVAVPVTPPDAPPAAPPAGHKTPGESAAAPRHGPA